MQSVWLAPKVSSAAGSYCLVLVGNGEKWKVALVILRAFGASLAIQRGTPLSNTEVSVR